MFSVTDGWCYDETHYYQTVLFDHVHNRYDAHYSVLNTIYCPPSHQIQLELMFFLCVVVVIYALVLSVSGCVAVSRARRKLWWFLVVLISKGGN